MKKLIIFLFGILLVCTGIAQNLVGAWEAEAPPEAKNPLKTVVTFTKGYQVWTTYNPESGAFVSARGGSWRVSDNKLIQSIEFDTERPEIVGSEIQLAFALKDNKLTIPDSKTHFHRVDNGTPGALAGAWLISGRAMDGKITSNPEDNPRKTMKILSGTRFQWIAYHTGKKEVIATGGGTYTTVNGKYTESIEFFSRDSSRAGMDLQFNYALNEEGDWHHTGLSSKGDPIDETWSLRPGE